MMKALVHTRYVSLMRWQTSVWAWPSFWRYGVYLELGRFSLSVGLEPR